MQDHYDVIIVGNGVVGATLARALAQSSLRVALVEASAIPINLTDTRSISLTRASQQFLQELELWPALAGYAKAIEHVEISDQGQFGALRLHAQAYALPAFGYVIGMGYLTQVLQRALQQQQNLQLFCPARVQSINVTDQHIALTTDTGQLLQARLLVGADGQASSVRQLQQIPTVTWDYQQSAIVTYVNFSRVNRATAYERFTPSGPLAVLPQLDQRCGLVWVVKRDQVDALQALSSADLITKVQEQFGYRLGTLLQMAERHVYPLQMTKAKQIVAERTVLLGNAAHSLHPIAAQGLNLGLQDVMSLAQQILQAPQETLGTATQLHAYQHSRAQAQQGLLRFTDGLVRLFSNRFPPFVLARQLGMLSMTLLPPLQRALVTKLSGSRVMVG